MDCGVDLDECDLLDPCDHSCDNLDGSYECSCDDGYFLKPDGYSCEEQLGCPPCQDNASCDEDSLSCQCDTGFELEGEDCININECESDTDNCAPNANGETRSEALPVSVTPGMRATV